MTTAQVVETSVTVNNDSPIQDYVHPDDQSQPTFEMTPGFKPFTVTVVVILTSHATVCKQALSHDRCNISFQLIKANYTFLSSLKKSDARA